MKVNAELDILKGSTVQELFNALDGVPKDAVLSVKSRGGGMRNEDTSYVIVLTWEVGNGPKQNVYRERSQIEEAGG